MIADQAPRLHRRPGVAHLDVDDEVVLWHEGTLHRLNPMAATVWAVLAEPVTRDEVVTRVAAAFGQADAQARPALLALLDQLSQAGVIEPVS